MRDSTTHTLNLDPSLLLSLWLIVTNWSLHVFKNETVFTTVLQEQNDFLIHLFIVFISLYDAFEAAFVPWAVKIMQWKRMQAILN